MREVVDAWSTKPDQGSVDEVEGDNDDSEYSVVTDEEEEEADWEETVETSSVTWSM